MYMRSEPAVYMHKAHKRHQGITRHNAYTF